nr:MAG TPA: hypothetical protein [Caudoviricetes sp.]
MLKMPTILIKYLIGLNYLKITFCISEVTA